MAVVFFPSCKEKQDHPRESEKVKEYLYQRFQIEPVGCCRAGHKKLTPDDKAIVLCPTCACIIEESSLTSKVSFLWEIIDQDPNFVFPNYHHEAMTIQDCWSAKGRTGMQKAVRSLLKKMNIDVIELEDNYDQTTFCGTKLVNPCLKSNQILAPKKYGGDNAKMFKPIVKDKQKAYFENYCQKFKTDKVVTYCHFCNEGIQMANKQSIHLIELLFPDNQ